MIAALFATGVDASEAELAAAIARGTGDDTVVWLEAEGTRFLALDRAPGRGPVRGTVLLAHAPGQHADWPEVMRPLRTGLAEDGWRTLSVQMPEPAAGGGFMSTSPDVARRLSTALLEAGVAAGETLVLIASGAAYEQVARFATAGDIAPAALVLISPFLSGGTASGEASADSASATSPAVDAAAADGAGDLLAGKGLAVLEVSAELDRVEVEALLERHRRLHARGEWVGHRALRIPGTRGDYRGQSELLLRRVQGWLRALPPTVSTDEPAADG